MISTTSYRNHQSTPENRHGCPIHLLSVFPTIGGDRLELAPHRYSTGMILSQPLMLTPTPSWVVDYVQWGRLCAGSLGCLLTWCVGCVGCVALQLTWLRIKDMGNVFPRGFFHLEWIAPEVIRTPSGDRQEGAPQAVFS